MNVISPILLLFGCLYFILRNRFFNLKFISKEWICLLFIIKSAAALIVTHHAVRLFSGDDGYFFYATGKLLFDYARQHPMAYVKLMAGFHTGENFPMYEHLVNWKQLPLFNDSETMIKLNSLLHFISFHSIYFHAIAFCFISFCGLTAIYKIIADVSSSSIYFLAALILLPSMLVFSSSILKESLLIGLTGLFLYFLYFHKKSSWHFMFACLFFILLLLIKPFFIYFIIPMLTAFFLANHFSIRQKINLVAFYLMIIVGYFVISILFSQLVLKVDLPFLISLTQQSSMKNSIYTSATSYVQPPIIASSFKSIITNSPRALLHTTLHPAFHISSSWLWKLASLENFMLIALMLLNILALFKKENMYFQFHLFIVLLTICMYVLIGYTCALEAVLARFKTPLLPFLLSGVYLLFISYKNNITKHESIHH